MALALSAAAAPLAEPKPWPKPGGFRLFAAAERFFDGQPGQLPAPLRRASSAPLGVVHRGRRPWPKGTATSTSSPRGIQIAGIIDASRPERERLRRRHRGRLLLQHRRVPATASRSRRSSAPTTRPTPPTGRTRPGAVLRSATTTIPAGSAGDHRAVHGTASADPTGDLFDPRCRADHRLPGRRLVPDLGWRPVQLAGAVASARHRGGDPALGWNFPAGNEDIIYFIFTFYNVTSARDADYYAASGQRSGRCMQQRGRTSRR